MLQYFIEQHFIFRLFLLLETWSWCLFESARSCTESGLWTCS